MFKLFSLFAFVTAHALSSEITPCSVDSFSFPSIFGAELHSITASSVQGYTDFEGFPRPEGSLAGSEGINVCNVTVSYTHPGHDDLVSVHVWLPTDDYNERFVGIGGGGWVAGEINGQIMSTLAYQGYAVASTDAGYFHDHEGSADHWLMKHPGNLNYPLAVNFAHRSLHELTIVAKHIIKQGYGIAPKFSYWDGCSTGGRQGLTIATKYPEDYDGILASSTGVDYPTLIMAMYWPQFVMNQMGVYPHACEFEAISEAVVNACDELDGVKDGVIARPDLCKPDLHSLIGKSIHCRGKLSTVSKEALRVYDLALQGPADPEGNRLAPGIIPGTALAGLLATANTLCDDDLKCTQGIPFPVVFDWIRLMVKKDPEFDPSKLTHAEYAQLFNESQREWSYLFGSTDPDLDRFVELGNKILAWHGIDDQAVPSTHMRHYVDRTIAIDQAHGRATSDYFRHFEVPGAIHCAAPEGRPYPLDALRTLQAWVENGHAPDVLPAVILGSGEGEEKEAQRPICLYPEVAILKNKIFTCGLPSGESKILREDSKDEL